MTGSSKTSSQLTEENYQRLLALFAKRDKLVSEQKFSLLWLMTLQRLEVPADNVQSLDLRDGNRLVGVWLKKHDYAGKLRRKEAARKKLQEIHDRERSDAEFPGACTRPPWGPETVKPTGKSWVRSDYVAIDPPLYPPELWLQHVLIRPSHPQE